MIEPNVRINENGDMIATQDIEKDGLIVMDLDTYLACMRQQNPVFPLSVVPAPEKSNG